MNSSEHILAGVPWYERVLLRRCPFHMHLFYIYELLNNIRVDDPANGLKKLMAFRKAYKRYDATIDKYLVKWIRDYYLYYQLRDSFKDIIYEYNLE